VQISTDDRLGILTVTLESATPMLETAENSHFRVVTSILKKLQILLELIPTVLLRL